MMNSKKCCNIEIGFNTLLNRVYLLIFVLSSFNTFAQSIVSLQLIPINDIKYEDITFVQDSLENYFNVKTKLGDKDKYYIFEKSMPKDIIYAKPFLDSLEKNFTVGGGDKIIFITSKRLSPVEIPLSFYSSNNLKYLIRGLASGISGSYGIVSTYKLRKETTGYLHFQQLLIKTVRHEFAHLLGLGHCRDENCLMKSGYDPIIFQNIDYKLCEKCQNLLDSRFVK